MVQHPRTPQTYSLSPYVHMVVEQYPPEKFLRQYNRAVCRYCRLTFPLSSGCSSCRGRNRAAKGEVRKRRRYQNVRQALSTDNEAETSESSSVEDTAADFIRFTTTPRN